MSQSYPRPAPDAGYKPVPNLPLAMRPIVAARALGISPRTLASLTAQGLVPCARLGRCVVYPTAMLLAWLETKTFTPDAHQHGAAARGVDDGSAVAE